MKALLPRISIRKLLSLLICITIITYMILLYEEENIPVSKNSRWPKRFSNHLKIILVYTKIHNQTMREFWDYKDYRKVFDNCEISSCKLTEDRSVLLESDAVIFHGRNIPASLPDRLPHQKWVYFINENPHNTVPNAGVYDGVFNWTMTYKRGSDIWAPYGTYREKQNTAIAWSFRKERSYSTNKTKFIAWATSNCGSERFLREQYAEKLQRLIKLDEYGHCSHKALTCKKGTHACKSTLRQYKFYMAFENALCEDYVTEKYWDQALSHDMVPIVFGGADYSQIAIPGSYINVFDYPSVEALVKYLRFLDENSTAYGTFFKWKSTYEMLTVNPFCELCHKLHDKSLPRKVKWDLGDFWNVARDCSRLVDKAEILTI